MKQPKSWFKPTLAIASSLLAGAAAQAQFTTNVLSDFHNFNLSATYANWNVDGADVLNGGSGFTPIITSGATSYRVQAQGYGSGAYDFAAPVNASGATLFQFTFTINTPMQHEDSTGLWLGPNLDISDGTHMVHMAGLPNWLNYGPYVGPGTYTLTGPLTDQFGGAPLDAATVTAFNLEFDPAEFGGGTPYDITYHSLVLLTPVPEPSSLALLSLGAIALAAVRRRARNS